VRFHPGEEPGLLGSEDDGAPGDAPTQVTNPLVDPPEDPPDDVRTGRGPEGTERRPPERQVGTSDQVEVVCTRRGGRYRARAGPGARAARPCSWLPPPRSASPLERSSVLVRRARPAVVLLLIAALPSQVEAAAALLLFAPMSVVSMAGCTAAFAWTLTRPALEPVYRGVLIPGFGAFGLLFGTWYVGLI
jgi:hypothetical protein